MERTCERALQIGLRGIAFTEHLDHTVFTVAMDGLEPDHLLVQLADHGELEPPGLDAAGYLAAIEQCRDRFPDLRILSGLEMGEPHWHAEPVRAVLAAGGFDRVLASVHCLPIRGGHAEPPGHYPPSGSRQSDAQLLAEVAVLVASSQRFDVLAHIDYPVRTWPKSAGPFDPRDFEDEFRHALHFAAQSGRAMEVNTRVPLSPHILRWWHDEGGPAITFGSDAHDPQWITRDFRQAAQLAETIGYRPGRHPVDYWRPA